jgi:hypothetical protein
MTLSLSNKRAVRTWRGWLAEGDGPDLVVMCVPAV